MNVNQYKNFKLEVDDSGIAIFTVNRPDSMNALNKECWFEFNEFMDYAEKDAEIKSIIITAEGNKAFVAGADLDMLKNKKGVDSLISLASLTLNKIQDSSKPIVAAVNGYAFGGGCELAIACDIRIVTDNAQFGLPETSLGVLPGAGGTQRLSRLIGIGRAKEVILAGRTISGKESYDIGLSMKCVEFDKLLDEARKVAKIMMNKGPVAFNIAKKLIKNSLSVSEEVGLLLETYGFSILMETEDKQEGISAFFENRKPKFLGR